MARAHSPAVNLLDYSSLPATSRLVCESSDDSLRILLPPVPLSRALLAMSLAGGYLLLCTAAILAVIVKVATDPELDGSRGVLPMIKFYVGFPVTLLCLWAAAIAGARTLWRRLRTPTSITLADDELVLITPNELTLRRDWPAGSIEKIEARRLGLSVSLHRTGELCIVPIGHRCVSVLRGQDLRELEWAARQLTQRLGLKRDL